MARSFVGLISDTHGLLRPQALEALRGSEFIIHAGDIGRPEILELLAEIAPVHAVRGNNDRGDWAEEIPERLIVTFRGKRILLLHVLKDLKMSVENEEIAAVVCGHSHRPGIRLEGSVLYVNPGSAGPRRFRLPVAVGRLECSRGTLRARIIELSV